MKPSQPHLNALFRALFLLLALVAPSACSLDSAEQFGDDQAAIGKPIDFVERFPEARNINRAMDLYARDPAAARAAPPMSVGEFFGQSVSSANIDRLRIERLRPQASFEGKPLAFLSAEFHGTDMDWNNRYKDVQLSKLFDAIGVRYVFPEASHIPNEGRALVRIWTDYAPVSKGAPEGISPETLKVEVARMLVASYVAGNMDGPAHNGNNGGFARFKDVSGRELWKGVLIDNGASWNQPSDAQRPWNANVLGTGAVEGANIPVDLVEGLVRMAQATPTELAELSKFEQVDDNAKNIVAGERARAREVLDHYGISYTPTP